MPEGRAANQPLAATTLMPPIAASLPGARLSLARIGSPASSVAVTDCGDSRAAAPSARVSPARRSGCSSGVPNSVGQDAIMLAGVLAGAAVISAASKSMIRPSLSVVQTLPSRRRKLAPALSSPPKQHEPSNRPGTNHLKPTGTS